MAVALAAAAGFVDAFIYVNVSPVFVANMSGNLIHLGILVGDGDWHPAVAMVVALASFIGGVVVTTIHHDRQVIRGQEVRPSFPLTIEAALLGALTTWLVVSRPAFTARPGPAALPVLAVAALAMGIQAGALRRVGEIAVATTYGTGAIVRIGEKAVLALRRADRPSKHRRRVTIAVLAIVLVSYVGGAALATIAGSGPWLLAAPTTVLVVCAAVSWAPGAGELEAASTLASRPPH
jgi:uncharacterized membrane protein YoaK (UPF0700 family)